MAEVFLNKKRGHDRARPTRHSNTLDVVQELGGQAVVSQTGHAFVKATMREQDAIYGGEMSAHHYFRFRLLRQRCYSTAVDLGTSRNQSLIIGFNLWEKQSLSIERELNFTVLMLRLA